MSEKIIALVDCDSFFVSCEQAFDESLQNKPVCVLSNNDACVIARSKEAKELGIKMGMPYFMAKKQFPDAVYLSGDIGKYKQVSKKIISVLKDFSPSVEVYSIDEAFIELTGLRRLYKKNYYKIAQDIRDRIKSEIGVTVSIGISKSKVLSKLACEKAKPNRGNGVYLIGNSKRKKLLKTTKVEEIWGIGKNTTKLFNRWGVLNCYELIQKTDDWLKARVGKRGVELKHELLGEYVDKVKTTRRLPKSIQNSRSFPKFTSDINYIKNSLNVHIHNSCGKLRHFGGKCKVVWVMLRTKDFLIYSDKKLLDSATNFELEISREVFKMLEKLYNSNIVYRSCGVTLDDITYSPDSQLVLFIDEKNKKAQNYEKLAQAIHNIEKKFGKNAVRTGFYKGVDEE